MREVRAELHVKRAAGVVDETLGFGKHKGKTFAWVSPAASDAFEHTKESRPQMRLHATGTASEILRSTGPGLHAASASSADSSSYIFGCAFLISVKSIYKKCF